MKSTVTIPKVRDTKKQAEFYVDVNQKKRSKGKRSQFWCTYQGIKSFVKELLAANALTLETPFPTTLETADIKQSEASRKILNNWFTQHPINLNTEHIDSILLDVHQKNVLSLPTKAARRVSIANTLARASNKLRSSTSRNDESESLDNCEFEKFTSRLVLGCEAEEEWESSSDLAVSVRQGYVPRAGRSISVSLSEKDTTPELLEEDVFAEVAYSLFKKSETCEETVQHVLKMVLEYSHGTELYLFRTTSNDTMVIDGAVGNGKVWSILQSLPLSQIRLFSERILFNSQKTERTVFLSPSEQVLAGGSDYYHHNAPEAVLCIPIIMHQKSMGALYLASSTDPNAFEKTRIALVSLVISNLIMLITQNTSGGGTKKRRNVPTTALQTATQKENSLVQDTIQVYNPDTGQWTTQFVVLSEEALSIFSSPFDTHPIRTVSMKDILDVHVSSKGLKQKNIRFDVWPVLPLKFKAKNSLIYIESIGDCHTWLAMESIKILHNWYDILVKCSISRKPQANQVTLDDIPVNIRIKPEEISVGSVIGQGGAATVYKGTWNNNPVAVKRLHDTVDQKEVCEFFDEIEILHKLRHPCIVSLMGGFVSDEGRPSIVFEYAERGSLNTVLYDPLSELSYSLKLEFMKQICHALLYLHSFDPPIIHRDLKPANILVTDNWAVKLADFGLARICNSTLTLAQGTVRWMAPELLSNQKYTIQVDIYSFALVMWEIIEQQPFFQEYRFNSQIEIQVVNHHARPPFSETFPPKFRDVIARSWDTNPDKRPSASELLEILSGFSPADLRPSIPITLPEQAQNSL